VELAKFTKKVKELKDIKEKWIYFVKNAGNMDMIPKKMQKPKELREAFESAKQMKWSKEELEAYDARGIYIQDERGRIEYALEEGEKIGIDKGKKIGIEKGEKVGYDKKAREMAKTMKKEGEPIEKISRYTNLSKEEIEIL
jgi:predicted transposase/invertase (TIGR01784 family)